MKLIVCLAFCAVIASSIIGNDALPAKKRMIYYQQPAQWYSHPQRMMYVQYVQPSNTHARSTQAASALVAGDTVATGTYLKDCTHDETDVAAAGTDIEATADESVINDEIAAAGAHGASSVAEAYPAEAHVSEGGELAATNDDGAKVPRDYQFENEQPKDELPAPAPLAPVVPAKRYLPAAGKKKIFVELDEEAQEPVESSVPVPQDAESDDDHDDDEEEDNHVAKYPNRRPLTTSKPNKGGARKPLPAGTFFPVSFGGTNGGAIAIANSFSTGEGGTATSHAVAYGSPDAAARAARPQPIRRH